MEILDTLYLIIGPSGSGKSTLVNNLLREFDWMKDVKSYTTRPKRHHKDNGHIFLTPTQFKNLNLIAYTKFNGYEYGATLEQIDTSNLYVIDVIGAEMIKRNYKNRPIITIGLDVSDETCVKRMKSRNDSDEEIKNRINNDKKMFENYLCICDVVLNANNCPKKVFADFIDKVAEFECGDLQRWNTKKK